MIKIGVNWWKNETAKGIYQLHHLKRETTLTLLYTLYIQTLLVPYNNDCKVSSAHTPYMYNYCISFNEVECAYRQRKYWEKKKKKNYWFLIHMQ